MNDTIKAILGLLERGKPELQVAAAQILGELHAKDPVVVRALAAAVTRSHVLGRFAVDALAKLGTSEAYAGICRTMLEVEPLAEHAAHLLAEAGAAAHPVLAAAWPNATSDQRARLLAILARHPSAAAVAVFVPALLASETAAAAAQGLLAAPPLEPAVQKALRDGLARHLEQPLPEACLVQVLQVLAKVDPQGSRPLLVRFTAPETPAAVRAAALRTLVGSKLTAAQVKSMLDLLEDPAQKGVHEAVREVLQQLPEVPEAMVPSLTRLLQARQPEQRLFALRLLRTAGGAELARVALKLLDHDDARFRDAAAAALAHNPKAVEPLVRLLTTTRDPARAEQAAAILRHHGAQLAPKLLRALAEKALKTLPHHTHTADLLLDLVLHAGGAKQVAPLLERAVRLRRLRRHAEALHLLAKLAATPHGDVEVQYQLALTKLLQDSGRGGAESAQPGNPTMGFFAALVRGGFPLLQRLTKETAVSPDALLRVAMHFVDAVGAERRFGADLLQHLATRTKGTAGQEARSMLRAVVG